MIALLFIHSGFLHVSKFFQKPPNGIEDLSSNA